MKTKKLAMQQPKPQKNVKPILRDIALATKLLLGGFIKLIIFTLGFLAYILFKGAVMALRVAKVLFGHLALFGDRMWQIREVRGFILGCLVTCAIAVFIFSQITPQTISVQNSETVDNPITENVDKVHSTPAEEMLVVEQVEAKTVLKPEIDWASIQFVSLTYQEKINFITERLKFNGVSDADIKVFTEIATLESCRDRGNHEGCMNPTKTPPVFVKHCKSASSGKWYVVEVSGSGGQAYCKAGDSEGRNEKSFGMYQILESTWERNGCNADKYTWFNQIDCAVIIKNRSGFTQWSTYKLI